MRDFWNRLESNPRFFTFFWGALGSFAVWIIVEYSGVLLFFLGTGTHSFLSDFIDSRFEKAAILLPTTYSYYILIIVFLIFVLGWSQISSKVSETFKKEVKEKDEIKNSKATSKWEYIAFKTVNVVIWLFFLIALLFISGESIVLSAVSDFSQHNRIIAPYIDDQEEEKIMSKWSQMESLEDYNNIYNQIVDIAKENNLKLKSNLHL